MGRWVEEGGWVDRWMSGRGGMGRWVGEGRWVDR
jgi:hypothetical protein